MDIISMAQHAKPKDIGQMELLRAQLTALSREAKRMPSSLRKVSSSPGRSRVTPFASSMAMFFVAASCANRAAARSILAQIAELRREVRFVGNLKVSRFFEVPVLCIQ